jgi:predicted ATPase
MNMLLLLHILAALSGLVFSTLSVLKPSQAKINTSFGLVIATILSGTLLVIATHSPILGSCITGLAYTGVTLSLIISARYRLAKTVQITRD